MQKSLKSLILNLSKEQFFFSLLNLCYYNYEKQLIFSITYGRKLQADISFPVQLSGSVNTSLGTHLH